MRPSLRKFPSSEAHVEKVYAHYEERRVHPYLNSRAYWLMGKVLRPHVSHTNAPAITEYLSEGGVLMLAGNHRSGFDPFVLAGAVGTDEVLKPIGRRGRAIAKISLFQGAYRPLAGVISFLGGIPAARDSDNDTPLGRLAREKLVELNTGLVANGQHHLVYPQGTRSREGDPFLLAGKPKTGVGRIAVGAAQELEALPAVDNPAAVAILPLAIHYPRGHSQARIHTEELIPVSAMMDPFQLTMDTVAGIQNALNHLRNWQA